MEKEIEHNNYTHNDKNNNDVFDILYKFGTIGYGGGLLAYFPALILSSLFSAMFWNKFISVVPKTPLVKISTGWLIGILTFFILVIIYGGKLAEGFIFVSNIKNKKERKISTILKYVNFGFLYKFLPALFFSFLFILLKLFSISLIVSPLILIILRSFGILDFSSELFPIMGSLSIVGIALSIFSEIQTNMKKDTPYEKILLLKIRSVVEEKIEIEKFIDWIKERSETNGNYAEKLLDPADYFQKKMEGKYELFEKVFRRLMRPMRGKNLSFTLVPPTEEIINNIRLEIIKDDNTVSKYFQRFIEIEKEKIKEEISNDPEVKELLNIIEKKIRFEYEFFDQIIQLNFKSLEWNIEQIKRKKPKTWNEFIDSISIELFGSIISSIILDSSSTY